MTKIWLFACLAVCLPARADELSELRERIAAQQKQIEELRSTLAEQQKLLEALSRKAAAPPPAAAPLVKPAAAVVAKPEAPLSFRIGAADFTPGGFMDFTTVFRSTNAGTGIGTSFGNIPFNNTPAGRLTETRFSAQNSRITLKVSAQRGKTGVTGYLESDFLGSLPANAHVSSNSDSLRMRLYWVRLTHGKWDLLGGQSWTMMTPNRSGISPVPSNIFNSLDVDTNYQVGLIWARSAQFRAVYHANRNWTAGFSIENPEQYTGGGAVLPSFYASQFDNGSNSGAPNLHPDFIGKVAWDGRAGDRAMHVEAAGLLRSFRAAHAGGGTSSALGLGGSINMNLEVARHLHLILNTFWSQGGGRYIYGMGPDVVVGPDGGLSPVHAASGIAGLEYQANPKTMLYAYYGGAYFSRNYSVAGPGEYYGFGFPGAPTSANRTIQEPTVGYIRTLWKDPGYGALQWMMQYSYVTRAPWSVPAGSPSEAHTHMVYTNLRYVLP
jgi:hypothetical protein